MIDTSLSTLIKQHGAQDIERAFVQLFVERQQIVVRHNRMIGAILEDTSESVQSAKLALSPSFDASEISDLVNMFELLVPSEDKKINGAFFTPSLITEFMATKTLTRGDATICDPSCGCGAFLIAASTYLTNRFGVSTVETIERNLFGVDIAEYSIRRAKILLTLLALQRGEDVVEISFNLRVADSLSADWPKLFGTKFDVVIGNPPYVKFQDLSENMRRELNTKWCTLTRGNFNLYFAFFELGVSIMKHDGVLAYITPNNYFTSLAGAPLREYLTSNKLIDNILDFNHLKLFQAQTYTCITVLRWGEADSFKYERVDAYEQLSHLSELHYTDIAFADVYGTKWRLLRRADKKNISTIEQAGERLGDVADIRVGIATCKDSVYFIDGTTLDAGFYHKTYKGRAYAIEAAATKPIAKISDFKGQQEIAHNSRRIIFPYQKDGAKVEVIKEADFQTRFPSCYAYLRAARDDLEARDKGKGTYPTWYAYARSQGLHFSGEKLLTPTFSAEPRFLLERDEDALFCNGYAVYPASSPNTRQVLSLKALAKILNSRVMDYYIKQTSVSIDGGYPCYQKNFIELFGIPHFSKGEIAFLESEHDKVTLDNFLIKKYDITI